VRRRATDSTLRPPPLPTGLAVDVVPAALAGLVERTVRAELARHHLAMFLSGAAGVVLGCVVVVAAKRAGWMP
jgi:hypothetical protein